MLKKNKLVVESVKPLDLLRIVKYFHKECKGVTVNGNRVSKKQRAENADRIEAIEDVNNGYDCSGFDPVLIVICRVYGVNIDHLWSNNRIEYRHKKNKVSVTVHSNNGHFWH